MKKYITIAAVLGMLVGLLAPTGETRAGAQETTDPWNDTYDAIALSVTNGMQIGLIGRKLILSPSGQVANGTNTLTLKTPFPFKGECIVKVASGCTNRVGFATNAVVRASSTPQVLIPDTGADTIILYVTATNKAIVVSGTAY